MPLPSLSQLLIISSIDLPFNELIPLPQSSNNYLSRARPAMSARRSRCRLCRFFWIDFWCVIRWRVWSCPCRRLKIRCNWCSRFYRCRSITWCLPVPWWTAGSSSPWVQSWAIRYWSLRRGWGPSAWTNYQGSPLTFRRVEWRWRWLPISSSE